MCLCQSERSAYVGLGVVEDSQNRKTLEYPQKIGRRERRLPICLLTPQKMKSFEFAIGISLRPIDNTNKINNT
ncbi:hypothetical protein GCM10007423_07230 [Dyadobacter endophyticus]|uniref:Uncharacterized protein n=1 Tax=Dyadobacter endophyticus TaxID=1749036 RepID=A0ABQ1YGT2_9BACT|nr:hypothetical protein GCM10007423_07230 [Dyadobacter endophyticus]